MAVTSASDRPDDSIRQESGRRRIPSPHAVHLHLPLLVDMIEEKPDIRHFLLQILLHLLEQI